MTRKILSESLVILIQTLLLLSVATWGIPKDKRRSAAAESFTENPSPPNFPGSPRGHERLNGDFGPGAPYATSRNELSGLF